MPTLLRVGPVALPTHDTLVVIGALVAGVLFLHEARRRGRIDERLLWIALGALFLGAVFAKAAILGRYLDADPEPAFAALWVHGGRSVLGGLAGAYAGVLIMKRLVGYDRPTGDLFAPAVAIGMAIGRVGCLLTEQVGTPTSLPWGVAVSPETAAGIPMCPDCAAGNPMHPSFVYEILFHLAALVLLRRFRDHPALADRLFRVYLLGYGAARFLIEFVRGNPEIWAGLTGSQVFLLVTLPLLAASLVRVRRTVPIRPAEGVA